MSSISNIKNKTSESRLYDNLKEFPIALRQYLSNGKTQFDKTFFNRATDSQLRLFNTIKYNVTDREFGGNNIDITNIYLNLANSKEVQTLIDEYIFSKSWVFHPVRKFEKWNILSNIYYNTEDYYWIILLFNRIVDPFTDLLNFNIVRIPNISFLNDIPTPSSFKYVGGDFKLSV